MGPTLFRYFFLRFLAMTLQFFAGLTLLIYIIDLAELNRQLSGVDSVSFLDSLMISALRVPQVIQTSIPFIILFAAMTALATFNRRYELVIARSAGISAWQFLAPLCLASLLAGIFALLVFNPLAAWSISKAELLEGELRGRTVASSTEMKVPWLRQQTAEGASIIGAVNSAERGRLLFNATVIRFEEDGRIRDRLDAARAVLVEGAWELHDVTIYRTGAERRTVDRMRIASGIKLAFIEEQFARPESIPFYELGRKIEAARSFGLNVNGFRMQFHASLATPLLLVAMTLIAATVSLKFARFGQSATMILGGILAGFLLYVVTALAKAFGSAGLVPPLIAAWTPVTVAMFYGVTFLLYKEDG
jgi:lipopolysaccharide export system permease protein